MIEPDATNLIVPPALSEVDPVVHQPVEDDREHLRPGDRVLLAIEDDLKFARILLGLGREQGFKVVVETRGDSGISMANELLPDAITLDIQLPVVDGWTVLDRLKRNTRTRHIPVHVITIVDDLYQGASLGAFAYLEKPVSRDAVMGALAHVSSFLENSVRRLLVVEDNERQRQSVLDLLGGDDNLEIVAVGSAEAAIAELEHRSFDCIVCDLMLPDSEGTEGLERIKTDPRFKSIPVVVYTGKDLTREDELMLKRYAASVILKGESRSPERLVDDTALFLHRVVEKLPARARQAIAAGSDREMLADRVVLVADDDARNVFAITSVLEHHELKVLLATDGVEALEQLDQHPETDLVLMDVMMPEMDGYEAMRKIRADPRFTRLPIIAITAKALHEDRQKCIDAGASDYLPKPIDTDRLISLMRMWLRR